jgi:hypothetical protein
MTDLELFEKATHGPWITAGDDVQYKVDDGLLCFQQSASKDDWLANFNFPAQAYRDMKKPFYVHRGFLKKWKSVRKIIAELDFEAIAGYSHGGPLAALAFEDARFRGKVIVSTTLFGSPRFLWKPNLDALMHFGLIININVRGDLVAAVPPWYTYAGVRCEYGPWSLPVPWKHEPKQYRLHLKE